MRTYNLLIFYSILGALGMWFYARTKDNTKAKELWTKYFMYLVIVFGVTSSLNLSPIFFKGIAITVAIVGLTEVINCTQNHKNLRFKALGIYTFITIFFLQGTYFFNNKTLLYSYIIILTFDGFSQIFGQLIGGPKLIPSVSPNKTIAGLVGGTLSALATCHYFNESFILTTSLLFFGLGGDLLASYLKRKINIKDYSQLIPGHGGILDRFDSYIMAIASLNLSYQFISLLNN